MMKDFNSNSRTLVVSFVLAVMFLIPLRFVELGNQTPVNDTQVLGVKTVKVTLPNANVETAPVLEAPYDEIEFGCGNMDSLVNSLKKGTLSKSEVEKTVAEISRLDKICK